MDMASVPYGGSLTPLSKAEIEERPAIYCAGGKLQKSQTNI